MRLGRVPGVRQVPPRLARIDDRAVLFESWSGGHSDNPRAISEALARREPGCEQVWATVEAGAPPNSRRYLRALGRSRYVVTNTHMPNYFRKKPGATYLQTWHGTPLKRIGHDIERPSFSGRKDFLTRLDRDVAKWDALVSPNPFSTDVFRRAFRYEGRIVETGYPRNDVLSSPDAEAMGAAVRRRLGIPEGVRTVLYAPTWRDDTSFTLELDIARLLEELGGDFVLLVRAHTLVADSLDAELGPGVENVSHYPDIRDLYLASDVLLTDYSSAMFDFAVTGRPMIFYTYDLAQYRDEVRGFYFDFEREAPGPLVATTAEVCDALLALADVQRQYADSYASFAQRFCSLEDGRASERVVDAVFTG
jgi:CDP-glycerol glycerophosphotransferase